jgi:hypothetical protein
MRLENAMRESGWSAAWGLLALSLGGAGVPAGKEQRRTVMKQFV